MELHIALSIQKHIVIPGRAMRKHREGKGTQAVRDSDFQIYIRHGRPPWRPSIFQKPNRMIAASGKWMAGTSPAMTDFVCVRRETSPPGSPSLALRARRG